MSTQQNTDLKPLLELFHCIATRQKDVEALGNGLDGPALNETRNATYHLLRALTAENEAVRQKEIREAESHAQRAVYDCHEAVLLFELDKLRKFQEDYKNEPITSVIPNWAELLTKAKKAYSLIKEARENNGDNRDQFYQTIKPFVEQLKEINDVGEVSRGDLNKNIRKRNTDRIIAVVSVCISIIALLFSLFA